MSDDVSDGVLIDVSQHDLARLLETDHSGLKIALNRILDADEGALNGWQSAI
jgi:FXSXX-COOH protein